MTAYWVTRIRRRGTKASVQPRVCAETVDLVAASAANPEMGERPQRRVNFVSLDQYDHEWPRSITEPHHRAVSVRLSG